MKKSQEVTFHVTNVLIAVLARRGRNTSLNMTDYFLCPLAALQFVDKKSEGRTKAGSRCADGRDAQGACFRIFRFHTVFVFRMNKFTRHTLQSASLYWNTLSGHT